MHDIPSVSWRMLTCRLLIMVEEFYNAEEILDKILEKHPKFN